MTDWLQTYADALANLSPQNLDQLAPLLSDEMEFKDPFSHSFSSAEFCAIMEDMFERLNSVRFEIHEQHESGDHGFLYWTFHGHSKVTGHFKFEGSSLVQRDTQGKIQRHYDFWDASQLMQQLPLVGKLIAAIRRKMGA